MSIIFFKNKSVVVSVALAIITLAVLLPLDMKACTTFCLAKNGEVLFGKNYDWNIDHGMVFVNKRGVKKTALGDSGEEKNPVSWVSKYGNVTFNQYGRENPSGGINEKGLVIELMWLEAGKYPAPDSRPALGTLEWIQYQLDTSATIEDVIKNSSAVRIASEIPLHYLVSDKTGNVVSVEFLDGKPVFHTGKTMPVKTLTNDTYSSSLAHADKYKAANGLKDLPKSYRSLDRFTRAAWMVKDFENAKIESPVKYAFSILADVAQGESTQWSIVYDQKNMRVYFRTRTSPKIKNFDVTAFDFSCSTAVKIFDMNTDEQGAVTGYFADYTRKANRDLIERSFSGTPFLTSVPKEARDELASYPEAMTCIEPAKSSQPTRIRDKRYETSAELLPELFRQPQSLFLLLTSEALF
jgi:penicillin V acylase-like amidase (Ntn superfamily)